MKILPVKKIVGLALALIFLLFNYSPYVQNIRNLPSELQFFEGDTKTLDLGLPFHVKIEAEGNNINVLKFNGNSLKDRSVYRMNKPLHIQTVSRGDVLLYFKLFGLIPIKQVKVRVYPQKKLIPGGNSIGVSLYTRGALVVAISEVIDDKGESHCPAMDAGIRAGDIIERVNGIPIKNAEHLSELVNKVKKLGLDLEIRRGDRIFETHIIPVKDSNDSQYRLGIWVRDSAAGVGTLTFYDPETGYFGALGHAITDVDTGTLLDVKNGEILQSDIIDVKRGEKGDPGELRGVFMQRRKPLGRIIENTKYGIYGKMYDSLPDFYYKDPLPVACRESVHLGRAQILSTVDETGVRAFDVEIIKINKQSYPSSKGMVLRIIDPQLLKRTGGIVQGMSGSPIIQDGKIVGAVTHVFINDPTKGYGIFIEWMLEESKKICFFPE